MREDWSRPSSIDHGAARKLIKQVFFQVPTKMPSGYATGCPTPSQSSLLRRRSEDFPLLVSHIISPPSAAVPHSRAYLSPRLKIDPVTAIGDIWKSLKPQQSRQSRATSPEPRERTEPSTTELNRTGELAPSRGISGLAGGASSRLFVASSPSSPPVRLWIVY